MRKTTKIVLRAASMDVTRRVRPRVADKGIIPPCAPERRRRLTLDIRTKRNMPAFAGYLAGTAKTGIAKIVVNVDALLWATMESDERGEFRRSFIDSLAHEFIHALEDSFGLLFDEAAVEASIAKARSVVRSGADDGCAP